MTFKFCILALCSTALVGIATLAHAQSAAPTAPGETVSAVVFDLKQLPAFKGTVKSFTLTPRGDIDGLILADGTEVKTPPHLTSQIVAAIKVGDAITVRGLRAASIPLVAASSVTNDSSGTTVVDNGPPGKKGGHGKKDGDAADHSAATAADVQGRVKMTLHGRKGEVNGALLEDGTVLRLPPPEAARLSSMLAAGQAVAAHGMLTASPYGKVLAVQGLGASMDKLTEVQGPPAGGKHGKKHQPKG